METFHCDMLRAFLVCVLISAAAARSTADVDMYQDLPDELIIEELAKSLEKRHEQELQRRFDVYGGDVSEPLADFSFEFPPDEQHSKFAVAPPDPKYYEDTRPVMQDNTLDNDDTFELPQSLAAQPTALPAQPTALPAQPDEPCPAEDAQVVQVPINAQEDGRDHIYFIAIVGGCSAAAVVGVIAIAISWYKLQRNAKAAADVEYPAYGVTGPHKDASPTGDRKLAQSAQMYHYQHQKQQIIALENRVASERAGSVSEAESDEENEEGDYTVYECPGLAPTGEMEVKNPLFLDDPTPATPAVPANQSKPGDTSPAKK